HRRCRPPRTTARPAPSRRRGRAPPPASQRRRKRALDSRIDVIMTTTVACYGARMRVEVTTHESSLLTDNPLGDPAEREVIVMLPPSYDDDQRRRFPVVLLLPGFGSTGWQLAFNRSAWQVPVDRRIDE